MNFKYLEQKLVEWATQHDYPLKEREWRDELTTMQHLENDLEEDLAKVDEEIREPKLLELHDLKRSIEERHREFKLQTIPDFSRIVYSPTGFLKYFFNAQGDRPSNNRDIENVTCYTESLEFWHGKHHKLWRKEEITLPEREENVDFMMYTTSKEGLISRTVLYLQEAMKGLPDVGPYKNGLSHALCLLSDGRIEIKAFKGRKFDEEWIISGSEERKRHEKLKKKGFFQNEPIQAHETVGNVLFIMFDEIIRYSVDTNGEYA